jgi:hypothetical protein
MSTRLDALREDPMKKPEFVFVVPFLSKTIASDWDAVSRRLLATIKRALTQTDSESVRVMLCCHEVPDGVRTTYASDPRVRIVQSPVGPPTGKPTREIADFDKYIKQKIAFVALGQELSSEPRHVMLLDGDDLVSRELVKTIRAKAVERCVVFKAGYVFDISLDRIVYVPRRSKPEHTFDWVCGSSGVFWMESGDYPESLTDGGVGATLRQADKLFLAYRGHKRWEEAFRAADREYIVTNDPLVLYVKNHGENLTMRKKDGSPRKISAPPALPDEEILTGEARHQVEVDFDLASYTVENSRPDAPAA